MKSQEKLLRKIKNICSCTFFILLSLTIANSSFAQVDCVNQGGDGKGEHFLDVMNRTQLPSGTQPTASFNNYWATDLAQYLVKATYVKGIKVYDGANEFNFSDQYKNRDNYYECNYKRTYILANQVSADAFCNAMGYKRATSFGSASPEGHSWFHNEANRAQLSYTGDRWIVTFVTGARAAMSKSNPWLSSVTCGEGYECYTDSDCATGYKCEGYKCVKKAECEDEKDNDNDGLTDLNDLGCKGYDPSKSGTGEVVLTNDTAGQYVNDCKTYTMKDDGKVLITLRDDDVAVVVKRAEDSKTVILAKSNDAYGFGNCAISPAPINVSQANARTNKSVPGLGQNDAVFYDRNANEKAYYPADGSETVPAKANSDDTIQDRIVSLKKGDIIYLATRSDKSYPPRNPNTVQLYNDGNSYGENLPYTYTDTDEQYKNDDIYYKGTTTFTKNGQSIPFTDSCNGDYVNEYRGTTSPKFTYSNGSIIPVEGSVLFKIKCEYGCSDGACKRQCVKDSDCPSGYKCENYTCVPKDECNDTKDNDGDGLIDDKDPSCKQGACPSAGCKENYDYTCTGQTSPDYSKKTSISYSKGGVAAGTYTDSCASDGKTLNEYVCISKPNFGPNGAYGQSTKVCDKFCVNGACVECKEDKDCENGYSCVNNKCTKNDECKDTQDNDGDGLIDDKDPSCKSGSCPSGGCKETYDYTCEGQTSPDYTKQTSITYSKGGVKAGTYTDSCESDGKTLNEYVCINKPNFGPNGAYGQSTKVCDKLCTNGACVECIEDKDCADGMSCSPEHKCVDNREEIIPLVECVIDNKDGSFSAYFGYENPNKDTITIQAGIDDEENNKINLINDSKYDLQTSDFEPGRIKGAFYVVFKKDQKVTWKLKSSSKPTKTVEATSDTTKCAKIIPYAQCIDKNKDGTYIAHFGYENKNEFDIDIPVGVNNKFEPAPIDRGQPDQFINGKIDNAVAANFVDSVSWVLNDTTVSLSTKSSYCTGPHCTSLDIKEDKAKMHGDEFVANQKKQTSLLLAEKNPYPLIRDIKASAKRRNNRTVKVNENLKNQIALLPDELLSCDNEDICPLKDNKNILDTIKKRLRNLRRKVGRTIRQRNMKEADRNKLLNENTKLLNSKLEIVERIPRFANVCEQELSIR